MAFKSVELFRQGQECDRQTTDDGRLTDRQTSVWKMSVNKRNRLRCESKAISFDDVNIDNTILTAR